MERRDCLVYPWQVDARVAQWLARHRATVRAEWLEQYTRHKVWSMAVSDRSTAAEGQRANLSWAEALNAPWRRVGGSPTPIDQSLCGRRPYGAGLHRRGMGGVWASVADLLDGAPGDETDEPAQGGSQP